MISFVNEDTSQVFLPPEPSQEVVKGAFIYVPYVAPPPRSPGLNCDGDLSKLSCSSLAGR